MRILLVTRGSQGDIYPYLRLAVELKNRGHYVTLSVPRLFEKHAKDTGIRYIMQASDDIHGMLEDVPDTKNLLKWTRRVIDSQFKELIPLLKEHDLMVATNTEFAANSIAEYCGKPLIRTAYGPFIPSRTIMPPVFSLTKPILFVRPAILWKFLNSGMNIMTLKTINKNRKALGMSAVKDQADNMASTAFNFLLYSKFLGNVDNNWKYKWNIGGYCFNDMLPYDKGELERLIAFIKKDERKTVFFTLGSCNMDSKIPDRFAEMLLDLCTAHNYKLIVACGWWDVGAHLQKKDNFARMESVIPHCLIFPHCDALIHHGGVGTTHSAARSGRPQMIVPLLLDQFYWRSRILELGLGPGGISIKNKSRKLLERKLLDLMNNPSYREKARFVGDLLHGEEGIKNFCNFIEEYQSEFRHEEEKQPA